MLNIILFGPPGAGKGTQSEKLIAKYKLLHLSTGDLLRSEIAANTPLGIEAKKFMDEGKLVPDEVVIGMIENKLEAHHDAAGFIFDGFPRTVAQAKALDELLAKHGHPITAMVAMEVPHVELVKRLVNRGLTSGRSDDTEEVINKRIDEYESKTRPVAKHYETQQKFSPINGIGEVEEVFDRIIEIINNAPIISL
jgi:adenylate kinase